MAAEHVRKADKISLDELEKLLDSTFSLLFSQFSNGSSPPFFVDSIKAREGRDSYVRLPRRPSKPRPVGIQLGDRVRVVAGPLFGHDGLVAGMASHQRVTVLLATLGKVTMPRGDVRVV